MRRVGRILLVLFGVLAVLLVVGITMTVGWRPVIGPKKRVVTDKKYPTGPERVERGRYLVNNVLACLECHSERDWSQPGAPAMASALGAGRNWKNEGMPWLNAPNITPDKETGLGNVSDDALARAIREGIGHDDRTLFPLMPYAAYRNLSDEDLASVIAYLRTLPPIKRVQERTILPFPVNRLINSVPQPVEMTVPEPGKSPLERGRYLTTVAACADCHTPMMRGNRIETLAFAGGFVFEQNGKKVASVNITPDPTGMVYDENAFVTFLRTGQLGNRTLHAVMPWTVYRGMTDEDLKAVYAYLRTVKPVKHIVDNSAAPTLCKLDQQMHGGGEKN